MYYENKRSFYIKQYGPVALVIVAALALIVTGVVIGFNSMNNSNVVAENPKPQEQVSQPVVDSNAYTYTAEAITGTVTSTNGLTVTVNSNNSTYDINLIGIMQNDKNTELPRTIANDLKGKTVTVDYDNVKTEDGKVYGYIYVDGTLYNETLLAKGLAELRPERQNIDKLDLLVAAQIKARHEGLGIWKY
ncbi:MAG: thermonuclease family protein [Clostridia bacterium]|nr:thermonuclease family protein [Clostridia bacterium]